jgi:hypothetical protein
MKEKYGNIKVDPLKGNTEFKIPGTESSSIRKTNGVQSWIPFQNAPDKIKGKSAHYKIFS